MRNRCCFIICYFGDFPNYFPLFLKSCEYNREFEWLIITDNKAEYDYPINVRKVNMSFSDVNYLINKQCNLDIVMKNPYKLCDFKPLYGKIFAEYLNEFSHFGHCDIDVIMGKLASFVTDDLLDKYDRLFDYGHMSIYKKKTMSEAYKLPYSGLDYRKVLSSDYHFGFDEFRGMNVICQENDIKWYRKNICADINRNEYLFYLNDKVDGSDKVFLFDKGHIYCYARENDEASLKTEYAYVHLQKRKMKVEKEIVKEKFYIVPNRFQKDFNTNVNTGGILFYRILRYLNDYKAKVIWNIHWRVSLLKRKIELVM